MPEQTDYLYLAVGFLGALVIMHSVRSLRPQSSKSLNWNPLSDAQLKAIQQVI